MAFLQFISARSTPPTASRKGYDFTDLSYSVIGACQHVQCQSGVHCTDVDYQRALELALSRRGLSWPPEAEIPIVYEGVIIARRRVDFVIEQGPHQLILET